MRIAVDVMGGDFAPREIVAGAVQAARALPDDVRVILVGDQSAVAVELARHAQTPDRIEVFHASEVIGMDEHPATAVRRKKDASVSRAVDLVKQGKADAMMSAGNTGAVVVAAKLKLRTLPGIDRPAIATVMPSPSRPYVLIDAGANPDCSARHFVQLAVMGKAYAKQILGVPDPVIGLMSVGTEETKGNEVTKEAFGLLEKSGLNFKGNIEGHDLFTGLIDVVLCDGFVGNVVLKTSESVGHAVAVWIKKEFSANPMRMLGAMLLHGAIASMKRVMDPSTYGGAPLLGVNGVCIIAHGASNARAAFHAIRVAAEMRRYNLNERIAEELARIDGASTNNMHMPA